MSWELRRTSQCCLMTQWADRQCRLELDAVRLNNSNAALQTGIKGVRSCADGEVDKKLQLRCQS